MAPLRALFHRQLRIQGQPTVPGTCLTGPLHKLSSPALSLTPQKAETVSSTNALIASLLCSDYKLLTSTTHATSPGNARMNLQPPNSLNQTLRLGTSADENKPLPSDF